MHQTPSFSADSVSKRSIPLVLPGLLFFLVAVSSAFSQIRVTGAGSYLQNFDPLAGSGTDLPWANNSTLPGWFLYRQPAPGTDLLLYSAGSGTRAIGSIYSFGNGSDRALGGLGSNGAYFGSPSDGAVAAWIAFAATNDTGRVLTGFTVSFDGEQWRNGSNTTVEEMVLEYGIGQTFAGVSTWTAPGDRFNWSSVSDAPLGALDGNASANRLPGRGGTVTGLSVPDGGTLWLRWVERNHPSTDHGMAIDNFSFAVAIGEVIVEPPNSFVATGSSKTEIDLSWVPNLRSHPVLLATSPDGVFGSPVTGQSYGVGQAVSGGGTVIYSGDATAFAHTGLTSGTRHFYRLWSLDASRNYSAGVALETRTAGDGLKIFHVNDAHSRLHPHDYDVPEIDDVPDFEQVGGAACLVARMLQLKTEAPNALVLDAGDFSEGSPLGDLRGSGGMIDCYNLLDQKLKALTGRGIDAAVVGNHDVRFPETLASMRNQAHFPFISVNIIDLATGQSYFPEHVIVEADGKRVGILGYTTDTSAHLGPETEKLVRVAKCGWDHANAEIKIKDKVNELRNTDHCDMVILLAHIGHSRVFSDDPNDREYQLVKDAGGVKPPEAVITGHWHSFTGAVWQPCITHSKTVVAEAASYMQYIGEVQLDDNGRYSGAQKHLIDNALIPRDPDVQTLVQDLTNEYNASNPAHGLEEVIGFSGVDLRLNKNKWWTHEEFPWAGDNTAGAWVADAMAWRLRQSCPEIPTPLDVDLAMQSGGGVRRDNAKGPITYREIYETYPWRDDNMVVVDIKGQEIWSFIQNDLVGTSISQGWKVYANDGIIWKIEKDGIPIDPAATFRVAVSSYMFDQFNDQSPVGWSDPTPITVPYSIRQSMLDYTALFTESNPMDVPGPRYVLDTELSGRFRAVVTMLDDQESQPFYESVWVRLLSATPDTVARRGGYVPADLVNDDGSINPLHQFSESMLYRSYLGFPDGVLVPGSIIDIEVEGGFYGGNPQLIDQTGIVSDGVEFSCVGQDLSLAQPGAMGCVNEFWDEWHENHLVTFQGEKLSNSRVKDRRGVEITIYNPGGSSAKTLPGNIGDQLELTGVQTYRFSERRFRCAAVTVVHPAGSVDYAPYSSVTAIAPETQSAPSLLLEASASDVTDRTFANILASDDADISSGHPDWISNFYPAGSQTETTRLYLQSSSTSVSSYGNEWIVTQFNLSSIPQGANIQSAQLRMYCFQQNASGSIRANAFAMTDAWDESVATWNGEARMVEYYLSSTQLFREDDQWYEWDVTSAVQSQVSGDGLISIAIKPEVENSASMEMFSFNSKAYAGGNYGPFLEVHFAGIPEGGGSVARVDFNYRFSPDNRTWSPWKLAGSDSDGPPWQMDFQYPDGHGYYEFYSAAVDNAGNGEGIPAIADARVKYRGVTNRPPTISEPVSPHLATDVVNNPWLRVAVDDPDHDILDVSFFDGDTNHLIGVCRGVAPGGTAQTLWPGLLPGAVHPWHAVVSDGNAIVQTPEYSFLSGAPSFSSWASLRLGDPEKRRPEFDGGDGVLNAFEYALNLNPDDVASDLPAFRSMLHGELDDPTPEARGDERLGMTFTDPALARPDVTWRVVASNLPRDNADSPTAGAETQILAIKTGAGPWIAGAGMVRNPSAGKHTIVDSVTAGGSHTKRFIWAEVMIDP